MHEELDFGGDMVSSVLYRMNLQWAFRQRCSGGTGLPFSLSALSCSVLISSFFLFSCISYQLLILLILPPKYFLSPYPSLFLLMMLQLRISLSFACTNIIVISDFSVSSLASLTSSLCRAAKVLFSKRQRRHPSPQIILHLPAFYGFPEYKFPTRHKITIHLSFISYLSLSLILFCTSTKLHSSLPIY